MHFSPLPYLDPGSGSILIQMIIAGLLGLTVTIAAFWGRIKTWLGIKSKPTEDEDNDESAG